MPIRTNRGRAAVYRKLWGWPMRSPRHLIVTFLVVFAVVLTIGLVVPRVLGTAGGGSTATGAGTTDSTNPTAAAPATGTAPVAATTTVPQGSLPTRITAPSQAATPAPPAARAMEVANRWAKAWVNHPKGVTTEQWLNGLRDFTTEEQLAVMSSVDPENIPATAVTGAGVATSSYTTSVNVNVPTNGGTVSILVIATPQGWRVAHYEQA